jgi:peptide-methionine (S)-S-oxide reductase
MNRHKNIQSQKNFLIARPTVYLLTAFLLTAILTLFSINQIAQAEQKPQTPASKIEVATFAGGCFWCLEAALDKVSGIKKTTSGYNGGSVKDPNYKQVSSGQTGHYETVQVEFDPSVVSYAELLKAFWKNIDPLDDRGQFCDKGPQYRSGIFYHSEDQKIAAEKSLTELQQTKFKGKKIATEILKMGDFYPAEGYHQDYYQKNPVRYKAYYYGCGRARRLAEVWGS